MFKNYFKISSRVLLKNPVSSFINIFGLAVAIGFCTLIYAFGNFSGTIDATYITASGGGTTESLPSLPWTKSIVYQSTVSGTTLTIGGGGGVAGQTVKVKVFAGGLLASETPGVANSSGIIVVASPTYVF